MAEVKIIIIFLAVVSIIALYLSAVNHKTEIKPKGEVKEAQTETVKTGITSSWHRITDPNKISLIANFDKKDPAEKIKNENNCAGIINGGFYDTNYKPLGLWVSDDMEKGKIRTSKMFNAFVIRDQQGIKIATELPKSGIDWAFQTGPLLINDGITESFDINQDKQARRMFLAIDSSGTVWWGAVYNAESQLDGPLLADLPGLITKESGKNNLNIRDAVNLDGGSASALYVDRISIPEWTTVGSVLCEQQSK